MSQILTSNIQNSRYNACVLQLHLCVLQFQPCVQIIELSDKVSTIIVKDLDNLPKNITESEHYDKIIANLEEENATLKSENSCYYYQNNSLKQMITSENIIDSITCVICNDNRRNVLFKPCNHLVICDTCSGKTDIRECIMCKQYIDCFEYAYII